MTDAPFCNSDSVERKPHETDIQSTPAFFAVMRSTSESPIYTVSNFSLASSSMARRTVSGAGFLRTVGFSPMATLM